MARNLKRSIYEEEQEQYEERNKLFLNQKNADGKFHQTMQNKKFMFYGMGVIAVLCLFGIMKHFIDIVDPKANMQQQVVAQQQPQTPTAQQTEAEREKEEQRIANEENERELKNLQSNFNPFEGGKYENPVNLSHPNTPDIAHTANDQRIHDAANPPMMTPNQQMIHNQELEMKDHATMHHNHATTEQETYQTATKKHNPQEPTTDMHENINHPNHDIPMHDMHTPEGHTHDDPPANINNIQPDGTTTEKELYELKGFANDGGTTYCYVSVNGSTQRVTEGDRIGTKTIQKIGQNFIVIEDENGTQEMLSM